MTDLNIQSDLKQVSLPVVVMLVVLAAVLSAVSYIFINAIISYAAVSIVLFAVINESSKKRSFFSGVLFGAVSSFILNFWMIAVITDYVKGSFLIGLLCYLASALVLSIFFGLQFFIYGLIRKAGKEKFSLVFNAFVVAAIWVLFEWTRSYLFSAMPWLSFSAGITLSRNLYLIQPAAFGGTFILSFFLVFSSWIIANAFHSKKWKLLLIPASLMLLEFAGGALILNSAQTKIEAAKGKSFSAAIIQPALSPEAVWDDTHANELVGKLFSLGAQAAGKNPDLIVWTETVVPWTFAKDDDFLKELAKMTAPGKSYTLIGMNRTLDKSGESISNAAHLFTPKGTRIGSYDKQDLLTLVEKPLFSNHGKMILPFLSASGLAMFSGKNDKPVKSPFGKAGILLCNESASSFEASERVKNGAGFLVNMGNDNWFSDTYIADQHFYNCRMRAVENRKDIIVNNNMGFAGLIKANGEISAHNDASIEGVQLVNVQSNNLKSSGSSTFVWMMLAGVLSLSINKVLRHKINK